MTPFRLLLSPPADGAWNMAVDEAILLAVGKNESLPTLRLYAWEPACLSLGHAQSIQDVDVTRLQAWNWGLVRRMTGGRAILHANELTYSITIPSQDPLVSGSILNSYRRIAGALLRGLAHLEIPVEMNPHGAGQNTRHSGAVCFEEPSSYEITFQGKKLIGSAQKRSKHGVLQHGSLPLWGDIARITDVLDYEDESQRSLAAERVRTRATTVEAILGQSIERNMAARMFVRGFVEELGITFVEEDLTQAERKDAGELVESRYAHPGWTGRV